MSKTVIAIAGEIASGKGSIAHYISEYHGAHLMRYSSVLSDILARLSLDNNRSNLASLAEALRTTFGRDVLSRTLMTEIDAVEASVIILDGVRKEDELYRLRKLDRMVFLFVDASIETRYRRIVERNEKTDDATKTFEDFKKDNEAAADREIALLKKEADFVIDNNGHLEGTHRQIDNVMKNIL